MGGIKLNNTPSQKVDETDRKIIRLLQEDSRKSFNKMADSLGIAVGTAYNRVKNLEEFQLLAKPEPKRWPWGGKR